MAIVEKLQILLNTKKRIKQALINKGVEFSDADTFDSYADKIATMKTSEETVAGMSITDLFLTDETGKLVANNKTSFTCGATDIDSYLLSRKFQNGTFSEVNFPNLTQLSGEEVFVYAFADNANLKTANFPVLTEISGYYSFGYAFTRTGLENFNAPNLTTISNGFVFINTFVGSNITSLDFPKLSGALYNMTFAMNTSLKKIWLPKEVTTIKASSSLTSTTYSYNYSPFNSCSSDLVIYTDAPSKLEGWSDYCFHISSSKEATVVYGATHEEFLNA